MLHYLGYKFMLNGIQVESTYSNEMFITYKFFDQIRVGLRATYVYLEHSALGQIHQKDAYSNFTG